MSPRENLVLVATLRCTSALRWVSCATLSCVLGCGTGAPQEPAADRSELNVPDCDSNSDCDDGVFCNGVERCQSGACLAGSWPCGDELCNELEGRCVARGVQELECTSNGDCQDGVFCNGAETCNNGGCRGAGNPCDAPLLCRESKDDCVECLSASGCDDGLFCNGNETCADGICRSGSSPCGEDSCDEPTASCVPQFIAGDIFSFLTVQETELFRALTNQANDEITRWHQDGLRAIAVELARRGLSSGGSLAMQLGCEADQQAVEMRRTATWQVLDDPLGLSFQTLFFLDVTEEVDQWNCQRYPDPSCSVLRTCG